MEHHPTDDDPVQLPIEPIGDKIRSVAALLISGWMGLLTAVVIYTNWPGTSIPILFVLIPSLCVGAFLYVAIRPRTSRRDNRFRHRFDEDLED